MTPGQPYTITPEGSLALLAMGAEGINAWRHVRDGLPGNYVFKKPKKYRPTKRIKHQTGKRLAKKVLLIGWDAADWKAINPIMDAGHMPTLERLVNGGCIGNIATLDPPLSPMLWSSVATGHTADKHGILGFVQPDTNTQKLSPVLGSSRQRKAIWNILNQAGLRSHVVGWWPSHPAEPINGAMVSNFYQMERAPMSEPWPLRPGTIHPSQLADPLAQLRVHPQEITPAHILPFIPNADQVDQDNDKRLAGLAKILAHCASVQSAATWLMTNEPWDFTGVYFDGLDHIKHLFMRFHPPRQAHIPQKLFDIYSGAVTAAYRFHDMMLHYLLQAAGSDTTIILMSDHGFHPDHLRPASIPKTPAGAAIEHRHYGIICLQGQHIQQDERLYGATLLDVAPTILNLFGLPIGQDMDGKPLIQALNKPNMPEYIPTWEAVDGDAGQLPEDARSDPWAEQAMMEQLAELGYIETGDSPDQFARYVHEADFYLARVYLSTGRRPEALPLLEKVYAFDPTATRYAIRLAHCYHDLGRLDDCRRVVEHLITQAKKPTVNVKLLEALLLQTEGKLEEALDVLEEIVADYPSQPGVQARLGRLYRQLKQWPQAITAYEHALQQDPENASVYCDLASVYLYLKQYDDAIDSALNAVGLIYHQPLAHFYLAEGLYHQGEWEHATEAYQVCLSQAPGIVQAYKRLADLYDRFWQQPDTANDYRHRAATLTAQAT